jgi:predicted AAA+ superfamily ATPase
MESMKYIARAQESRIAAQLARGKSVMLFGPRQTGKTTLVARLPADLRVSLVLPDVRQRYERAPGQLTDELQAVRTRKRRPVVVLDEVQRVPALLDVVQDAVDRKLACFVLTGSSARKLRRGGSVNLLPGRVVTLHLDPFSLRELAESSLRSLLLYGSLPGIRAERSNAGREADLRAYVASYLEEEIRAEALVRNVGTFARFLELAGLESGQIVSFRAIAQELGIAHTTVAGFYEILEDCLVAERIDPLTRSRTRKKLTKSSRYLMFDLGVRRLCANEGTRLHRDRMGQLLEQFVGLELVRQLRVAQPEARVLFWRDPDGPEVDWIVERGGELRPIEVKWTDAPGPRDARHLETFLDEYAEARHGYIVCQAPRRTRISKRVTAVPWQELHSVL